MRWRAKTLICFWLGCVVFVSCAKLHHHKEYTHRRLLQATHDSMYAEEELSIVFQGSRVFYASSVASNLMPII